MRLTPVAVAATILTLLLVIPALQPRTDSTTARGGPHFPASTLTTPPADKALPADGHRAPPSVVGAGVVLATVPVGQRPSSITYDSGNGWVYVGNLNSANVSILSGTAVIGTVQTGALPLVGDYDGHDGYVYASNAASGNVSVISGKQLVGTALAGSNPVSGAFNARFGWYYVPNYLSNTVSVISGTTTLTNIRVGTNPQAAIYDPATGIVYVANSGSSNVSAVTGVVLVGTTPVGHYPFGLAVDGAVYVANLQSNNVSILVPGYNLTESVSVGINPSGLAFDPATSELYVANGGSNTVSVLSGPSVASTISVGTNPTHLAYDASNGFVYVVNEGSRNVSVLSGASVVGTIAVGSSPQAIVYDASSGFVYVTNVMSNTVTVIGTPPPSVSSFSAVPDSVPVGGSTVLLVSVANGTDPLTYSYTGLPPGCVSANVSALVCSPSSAGHYVVTVKVHDVLGRNATRSVALDAILPPSGEYAALFTESGLASGANWSVTLGGSTKFASSTSLTFIVANGTYPFTVTGPAGYYPVPGSGTVTVAGSATATGITFVAVPKGSYSVVWTETGLPLGTNWSVTLGGTTHSSTGSTILFSLPNGSYVFSVAPVVGYSASTSTGSVQVAGAALSEMTKFSPTGASGNSNILGLPPDWFAGLVGGIVVAVAIAVGLLLRKARGEVASRGSPPPPPPPV